LSTVSYLENYLQHHCVGPSDNQQDKENLLYGREWLRRHLVRRNAKYPLPRVERKSRGHRKCVLLTHLRTFNAFCDQLDRRREERSKVPLALECAPISLLSVKSMRILMNQLFPLVWRLRVRAALP